MSSLSQYDGWTVEEIVARNSHELTAVHVLSARQHIVEQRRENAEAMRSTLATMNDAHRIGLAVLKANRAGRKMLRVADLIGGDK